MIYTLNLLDHEIESVKLKISKGESTRSLTEPATITINKNILKELIIMKQFIHDNYPKLKTFYM
jgi:hypothetical protein